MEFVRRTAVPDTVTQALRIGQAVSTPVPAAECRRALVATTGATLFFTAR